MNLHLRLARSLQEQPRAPSPPGRMRHHSRNRRIELPIAGCVGCVGIQLAGAAVDFILSNLSKRRGAEMLDDGFKESLVPAALKIAQRGTGERNGSATTVDGFGEDFALTLRADFFRGLLVVSASAFFKSDSAERAADDPVW